MARRFAFLVATVALLVGATACGSDGSKPAGGSTSTTRPATSSTTHAAGGRTTDWSDVTAAWKTLAPDPFAVGPQQVADDLAARRRGQDTSEVGIVTVNEVRTGEPLVIVLHEAGGPDPAVAQVVTEITLEPGDEGWLVSSARQRSVCAAGSTANATTCS
jgi:hypothetical protein